MLNFGYGINKSSRIDLDKSLDMAEKVARIEPSFRLCIACGCCTSTCSVNNFSAEFNLRKTQLLVNRGELKGLRKEIEKCMLCGKCQMICPRGINTRNIVLALFKVLE